MDSQKIGAGRGLPRWRWIAAGLMLGGLVLGTARAQEPVGAEGEIPEVTPVESAEAIKDLWVDMRRAKNQKNYSEVCERLNALRRLGQDLTPSRLTAAYAYLVCARQKVALGDLDTTTEYLALSVQYGGEKPEHEAVRADMDSQRGVQALRRGELEKALALLQSSYSRGQDPEDNEAVSAALTQYAYEMHGRGEDVRALASLDAALLFYPRNRQAEILRREIWMWDYGMWIVIAFIVFGLAIYFVFRQWREVKIRETLTRGW